MILPLIQEATTQRGRRGGSDERIASRRAPQVMVCIDDCKARINDLFGGCAREPVYPRGEDATEGCRWSFGAHWCSPQIMLSSFERTLVGDLAHRFTISRLARYPFGLRDHRGGGIDKIRP